MTAKRMWILATLITLATASGFTSVPAFAGATADSPVKVVQIVIDKAAFGDTPAGIKVGDTIEWINNDIFDHTSTARTGAWDVIVPAGKKVRVVMKKAGSFEYYCKYHPNMVGTVAVKK